MTVSFQELIERANGRYYYVASPYTHPEPLVRERRALEACHYAGLLLKEGLMVLSPVWHSHKIACDHRLDHRFEFWAELNNAYIKPSAGIILLGIDGWNQSRGVAHELAEADTLELPTFFYAPDTHKISNLTIRWEL